MKKPFDAWAVFERFLMFFLIDAENEPEHRRPLIGLVNGLRLGLLFWAVALWLYILAKWFLQGS